MIAKTKFDERSWLAWLVKVRVLIITFLVGVELAISRLTPTQLPERLFIGIVVLWYAFSIFYILLLSFWQEQRPQAFLQVLTDMIMVSAVVYATGGVDSSFNFLYALIIVVATILLPRKWAYLSAALAFVMYGAVVELEYFEFLPAFTSTHPELKTLQIIIFINLFAYFAIAYLASRLSMKLRQADLQLQDTSGALENLQALHENVIRSISGGLLTTDLEGRITLANPAAQALLEKPESELIGQPVAQLFTDRLPSLTISPAHGEVRSRTSSGATKTFAMTVSSLVVPERGTLGWVYTFDDLTEIRRLEREIRLSERLAAVGRLAAAIAHEIRNPLSSISGSVKVLASIAALSDEQRTLVQVVTRESERLNSIISDFLSYAREKQYEFREQDLVPLLEDTLTLLENSTAPGSAPIAVVRNFEMQRAMALVDGDKIKQVFWNLCKNALRAMPGGGTLTVSVRPTATDWLISFADTGQGISQHQLERIFEPFQSHFEGGTGLGLAIVYEVVHAHEGKVAVRSVPGEGTVLSVQLHRLGMGVLQGSGQGPAERARTTAGPADKAPHRATAAVAGRK